MTKKTKGEIFIFLGPSGAGKTAVIQAFTDYDSPYYHPQTMRLITTTTRQKRPGEFNFSWSVRATDFVNRLLYHGFPWLKLGFSRVKTANYYFVTRAFFERALQKGAVVEHTEYAGNYYGSFFREINRCRKALRKGRHILMVLDENGVAPMHCLFPDSEIHTLYIYRPLHTLRDELLKRGGATREDIEERERIAEKSIANAEKNGYTLIYNGGTLKGLCEQIKKIIRN